ncbi:MAG: hypothetical protein LBC53_09400 [Spirochaetaceae bacterium]|nr:hypothetical protein [Spirochaetaceae bacterium]
MCYSTQSLERLADAPALALNASLFSAKGRKTRAIGGFNEKLIRLSRQQSCERERRADISGRRMLDVKLPVLL